MTRRRTEDDDERNLGAVGLGTALGGPVLGGALGLGGLLGEARPRPYDAAPIGSDPWLEREIRAALGRAKIEGVGLDVKDAVVTLRGTVDGAAERAVRAVQGIKSVIIQ